MSIKRRYLLRPCEWLAGVQNKLLEALAMGLPCVASTAAWNGTVVCNGEGILATDDTREFAEHVVRLLQDDGFRAAMAGRARAAVEANYRWDGQMALLGQVIAAVTATPSASAVSG